MGRRIHFNCQDCGAELEASAGMQGEMMECDHCGRPQSIPDDGDDDMGGDEDSSPGGDEE